jgi:hypothetical protein
MSDEHYAVGGTFDEFITRLGLRRIIIEDEATADTVITAAIPVKTWRELEQAAQQLEQASQQQLP